MTNMLTPQVENVPGWSQAGKDKLTSILLNSDVCWSFELNDINAASGKALPLFLHLS